VRVVLETNVLVSGVLNPHGPPGRLVDLALAGDLALVVDDRVLSEYQDVLRRPRFGLPARGVDVLVRHLRAAGEAVTARPLALALPDADDLPFLEVAAAGAATLVTGNPRHFRPVRGRHQVRVLSARQALDSFA
jgi:putative PIN family toxin of toxin-antitoxin system